MLPKKYRLTVIQFNNIPQKSKNFDNDYFLVKSKELKEDIFSKIVIIVPKFLDKRSSSRHLAKRMIEEILRTRIKIIKAPIAFFIKSKKILKQKDKKIAEAKLDQLLKTTDIL